MLAESHPLVRRFLRFLALPYCFVRLINWSECSKSKYQVATDLWHIFFVLKYYPDNYSPCRLDEKSRDNWIYYYGSTYNSYTRYKLRKNVQPFEYQLLFNDKIVCEQLCRGMSVKLPQYYGVVDPATDYKFKLESIFRNSGQNKLIIKPYMGHAGRGIDMAIKHGNKILIRTDGEELDIANYKLSEKAIIQEVVIQDERIAKISASSVNTIRVVTFYTKSDDVIIVSASMRFGVGTSIVDNWSSGGIAVGINHETGKLMRVAYDKHGNEYHAHPDSGVVFSTYQIQPWEQILQVAETVQKACPFYRMIGVDIAISKDGPVLIEVNANPDIVFQEQTAGPLLKNKKVLNAFAEDDLLINKYQKMLLKST